MNEITLKVNDKNLPTLLNILENLKEGLIKETTLNGKSSSVKSSHYKPRTNTIIKEEESGTHDTSGKYASTALYKQRLHKR